MAELLGIVVGVPLGVWLCFKLGILGKKKDKK